jgi:hypothetical protein
MWPRPKTTVQAGGDPELLSPAMTRATPLVRFNAWLGSKLTRGERILRPLRAINLARPGERRPEREQLEYRYSEQ